nr:hypothetical protein [Tanacetum cinerariifolium]
MSLGQGDRRINLTADQRRDLEYELSQQDRIGPGILNTIRGTLDNRSQLVGNPVDFGTQTARTPRTVRGGSEPRGRTATRGTGESFIDIAAGAEESKTGYTSGEILVGATPRA